MGINSTTMDLVLEAGKLAAKVFPGPIKVLSLGHQDILLSEEYMERAFGRELAKSLATRPDSDQVMKLHNTQLYGGIERIPDTADLFAKLGMDLTIFDFKQHTGQELVVDLNVPVEEKHLGAYHVIVDGGTLEHCFNVFQAMKNLSSMLAVGGCVFHGNPMCMPNHGFYSFSPTFYYDYYEHNGFEVLYAKGCTHPTRDYFVFDVSPFDFFEPPRSSSDFMLGIFILARKLAEKEITCPVQRIYR